MGKNRRKYNAQMNNFLKKCLYIFTPFRNFFFALQIPFNDALLKNGDLHKLMRQTVQIF